MSVVRLPMFFAAALLVGVVLSAAAEVDGKAPIIAIGNGRLTAGFNASGALVSCRWPSPGNLEQLNSPHGMGAGNALWAIQTENELIWQDDVRWRVDGMEVADRGFRLNAEYSADNIHVRQEAAIHPDQDTLAITLHIEGLDAAPQVAWYADFSPQIRLLPAAPLFQGVVDPARDFAAYGEGAALVQFRPFEAGAQQYDKARELATDAADADEWATLGNGVWIALGSTNEVTHAICGAAGGPQSSRQVVTQPHGNPPYAAVGDCDTTLLAQSVPAEEGYECTFLVSFAESHDEAKRLFSSASEQRAEDWPITGAAEPVDGGQAALLSSIRIATDAHSGAIVRAPLGSSLRGLVLPRDCTWFVRALDQSRQYEVANQYLAFLLSTVRSSDKPGQPAGTLPAALWADGTPALPEFLVDVEGAAWLLWALWQHHMALPEDMRDADAAFLLQNWDTVSLAGDFLAGWKDYETGMPLPSFDFRLLRDSASYDSALALRMGLAGAASLAETLGKDTGWWQQRLDELDLLLVRDLFGGDEAWRKLDAPLWAGHLPGSDGNVRAEYLNRLAAFDPETEQETRLRLLAEMSLLRELEPNIAAAVAPESVEPIGVPNTNVDALTAAYALIAAKAYGPAVSIR